MVLSDGSVRATGGNDSNQLGTNDYTRRSSFVTVYTPSSETEKCIAVACGAYHTQLVLLDGSVKAVGSTGNVQLDTFTTVYTPSSDTTKCIAVSCGVNFTHILLSDGSVRSTGRNNKGQLGTGNTTNVNVFTPVYTPSSETTKCIAVSSSLEFTHILLSDGSVRATGSNNYGQLGTGNTTQKTSFTTVYTPSSDTTKCRAVACGAFFTQLVLLDGSVRATGQNSIGQLGTGNTLDKTSFTTVYTPSSDTTKCTAVACGFYHTQLLLSDGSVSATGQNSSGQLGSQNGKNVNLLRYLNINVSYISTGRNFIAVIKSDGSVWTKGYNAYGQLGTENTTNVSIFTKVYDPVLNNNIICKAVSCGQNHTQILLSDGSVRATGRNNYAQLGNGNYGNLTSFTTVYDPTLNNNIKCAAVSCGETNTHILLEDGSVMAVGRNGNGELGTGDTTDVSVFTPVYTPSGDVVCIAVACGTYFTQLVLSDGSVRGTGYNGNGHLGTGNTTQQSSFTPVYTPSGGVSCRAVSCGQNSSHILLSHGSVRATGNNTNGQLGTGNYTQKNSFVTMLNSDGTNMANVLFLPEILPPLPAVPILTSINGDSPTRENPTISITVANPSDSTITNYSYSINGNTFVTLSPAQTSGTLTIPATGLINDTSYTFKIKAINDVGSSSASNGVLATFTILPLPPLPPTIVSVDGDLLTRASSTVSIAFTQSPANTSIKNYSYSTDGTNYTALNPLQKTSSLNIPVTGLTSGSNYTFQIKAINRGGTSSASTGVSSNVTIPLFVPSIDNITYNAGSVNIHFTQILQQESGVTGFKYSTNNGETYTSTNVTTSPFKISGLKPGIQHKIILKANKGSDSTTSNTYSFTYYSKVGKKSQYV